MIPRAPLLAASAPVGPWLLTLATLCAGCGGEPLFIGATVAPGALVIGAAVSDRGEITAVTSQIFPESSPRLELTLPGDAARVAVFTLPPDTFVDRAGVPLDLIGLQDLRVRMASEAADGRGSCLRCLAPSAGPKQVVLAGDSCPIPMFAEASLWNKSGGTLERLDVTGVIDPLRFGVRIDAPGDCACPRVDPPSWSSPAITLPDGDAGWVFSELSANGAGTAASFAPGAVLSDHPVSGRRIQHVGPSEVALDPLALALAGGDFLVASTHPGDGGLNYSRLDRWNAGATGDLSFGGVGIRDLDISVTALKRLRDHPSVYLLGSSTSFSRRTAIAVCGENLENCHHQTIDCRADDMRDVARLIDGTGIATDGTLILIRPPGSERWSCIGEAPGPISDRRSALDTQADRLFLCGSDGVWTASVSAANITVPIQWHLLPTERGCMGLFHDPNDPTLQLSHHREAGGSQIYAFNAGGQQVDRSAAPARYPELPASVSFRQTSPEALVASNSAGTFYVKPGAQPFRPVAIGASGWRNARLLAASPTGSFVLGSVFEGPVAHLRVDASGTARTTTIAGGDRSSAPGIIERMFVEAGATDSSWSALLLRNAGPSVQAERWRIENDQVISQGVVASTMGPFLTDAAPLGGDRFVLLLGTGEVRLIEGTTTLGSWMLPQDNPRPRRPLAASAGIAWIATTRHLYRLAGGQLEELLLPPEQTLNAVDVTCPDDVRVTALVAGIAGPPVPQVLSLEPAGPGDADGRFSLTMLDQSFVDRVILGSSFSHFDFVIDAEGGPVAYDSKGYLHHLVPSPDRFALLPFYVVELAHDGHGTIAALGPDGQPVLVRPQR